MTFTDVVHQLKRGLARPLPGAAAHALLAPRPRRQWPPGFNPARIRNAAGLIVVFPRDEAAAIVLTIRSERLRHGGQVSLPGGVVDPGETFEHAALREAQEEIDLPPASVTVVGSLTPLDIPVSGFRLHPIVAIAERRPPLRPADSEVARIIEPSISELMDASNFHESEQQRDGRLLIVPAFRVVGAEIWGATAMVLAELLVLLGWNRD